MRGERFRTIIISHFTATAFLDSFIGCIVIFAVSEIWKNKTDYTIQGRHFKSNIRIYYLLIPELERYVSNICQILIGTLIYESSPQNRKIKYIDMVNFNKLYHHGFLLSDIKHLKKHVFTCIKLINFFSW